MSLPLMLHENIGPHRAQQFQGRTRDRQAVPRQYAFGLSDELAVLIQKPANINAGGGHLDDPCAAASVYHLACDRQDLVF